MGPTSTTISTLRCTGRLLLFGRSRSISFSLTVPLPVSIARLLLFRLFSSFIFFSCPRLSLSSWSGRRPPRARPRGCAWRTANGPTATRQKSLQGRRFAVARSAAPSTAAGTVRCAGPLPPLSCTSGDATAHLAHMPPPGLSSHQRHTPPQGFVEKRVSFRGATGMCALSRYCVVCFCPTLFLLYRDSLLRCCSTAKNPVGTSKSGSGWVTHSIEV